MLEIIQQNEKFVNNKYKRWYINIINNRLRNPASEKQYTEKHHIAPKGIFLEYSRESSNIVRLTAKEHFVCHLLLTKFTKDKDYYKMCKALAKMTRSHHHDRRFTSGYYSLAKITHSNAMKTMYNPAKDPSVKMKLSQKSTGRKHTDETKRKISLANKGRESPNKGKKSGPRSAETKLKISETKKGTALTAEHRAKLREVKLGKKRGMYNRHKEYEKTQCVHCGKVSIISNINRWHNENCKTLKSYNASIKSF